MKLAVASLFLGLTFAGGALAQSHHDRTPADPFRREALGGNVHVLYGRGGNVGFFVGPDAVLVVDSQFEDIAPGILLVREAGGVVSDLAGGDGMMATGDILAACGGLHPQMLAVAKGAG